MNKKGNAAPLSPVGKRNQLFLCEPIGTKGPMWRDPLDRCTHTPSSRTVLLERENERVQCVTFPPWIILEAWYSAIRHDDQRVKKQLHLPYICMSIFFSVFLEDAKQEVEWPHFGFVLEISWRRVNSIAADDVLFLPLYIWLIQVTFYLFWLFGFF